MKNNIKSLTIAMWLMPAVALAAQNTFSLAVGNIGNLIRTLTAIAFSLAFLAFFWGFAKYLFTSSDEKKKSAASLMTISIAIIFVMLSVWGIIGLFRGTLGLSGSSARENVNFPEVQVIR